MNLGLVLAPLSMWQTEQGEKCFTTVHYVTAICPPSNLNQDYAHEANDGKQKRRDIIIFQTTINPFKMFALFNMNNRRKS